MRVRVRVRVRVMVRVTVAVTARAMRQPGAVWLSLMHLPSYEAIQTVQTIQTRRQTFARTRWMHCTGALERWSTAAVLHRLLDRTGAASADQRSWRAAQLDRCHWRYRPALAHVGNHSTPRPHPVLSRSTPSHARQ